MRAEAFGVEISLFSHSSPVLPTRGILERMTAKQKQLGIGGERREKRPKGEGWLTPRIGLDGLDVYRGAGGVQDDRD